MNPRARGGDLKESRESNSHNNRNIKVKSTLHPGNGEDPQGQKINPRQPLRSLAIETVSCS
jgi:hypothetical protein